MYRSVRPSTGQGWCTHGYGMCIHAESDDWCFLAAIGGGQVRSAITSERYCDTVGRTIFCQATEVGQTGAGQPSYE